MMPGTRARPHEPVTADRRRRSWPALVAAAVLGLIVLGATLVALLNPQPSAPPESSSVQTGPTRLEAGVPVGYARTDQGAAAAALNYSAALLGTLTVDERARAAALEVAAATPESAAVLDRAIVEAHSRPITDPAIGTAHWRWAPLGYDVTAARGDRAEVLVWVTLSQSRELHDRGGELELDAVAGLLTWRLVWSEGDWRVGDLEHRPWHELTPAHLRSLSEVRHAP